MNDPFLVGTITAVIIIVGLMIAVFWIVLTRKGVAYLQPIRDFAARHNWQVLTPPYFGHSVSEWNKRKENYMMGEHGALRSYQLAPKLIARSQQAGKNLELVYVSGTTNKSAGQYASVAYIFFQIDGLGLIHERATLAKDIDLNPGTGHAFRMSGKPATAKIDARPDSLKNVFPPDLIAWYQSLDPAPLMIQREADRCLVAYASDVSSGVRVADEKIESLFQQFQQAVKKLESAL